VQKDFMYYNITYGAAPYHSGVIIGGHDPVANAEFVHEVEALVLVTFAAADVRAPHRRNVYTLGGDFTS